MISDRPTQTSEDEIDGQGVQGGSGSKGSQKNCQSCNTCEHCPKDYTIIDCQCPDCHKFVETENSKSIGSEEKKSQDYQLEYHNTIWSEHEIEVDGVVLKEKKETTTVTNGNQANLGQTVVKHIRSIGNQTLTIHLQMILNENGEEVEGETDMEESEILSFL